MRALCSPMVFMAGIVLAVATLVPAAGLAQANPSVECADLKVAPKFPGSVMVSCDKGDDVEIVVPLKPDGRGFAREKSIRGHYEFREYQVTPANFEQEQVFASLLGLLPIAGSTVKYASSPSTITARNGDTWIFISVSGEYYDVKTVLAPEELWTPVRDALEISREMEAHNRAAIYGIQFSSDNTAVVEESSKILGEVVAYLKKHPGMAVDIESHKNSPNGTAEGDQEITRKRAAAVVTWFVAHGIASERLRAKPLGRNKPVTENDTALEIQRNERIELVQIAP